jgi:hypothetical protein
VEQLNEGLLELVEEFKEIFKLFKEEEFEETLSADGLV